MGFLTGWLGQAFVHGGFILPASLLISIPIIIHFINRMRFRRVRFAAMEFLLASQQKNRQRLLLEQLLLLLLRILAVAAIVALISRPILDPSLLPIQGQRTHHFIVIDDSGSMRDRWANTTAFDSALKVPKEIVSKGALRPGTQTLTLLLLSNPDQPVFALRTIDAPFEKELTRRLENLSCSHRRLPVLPALNAVKQQMDSVPGGPRNLHVVSDFRTEDWDSTSAAWESLKGFAADKAGVNLVRAVPEQHENLGLTDLSGSVQVVAANVPLRLRATVRNYGLQTVKNTALAVFVDGQKLPMSITIDQLEAGRETAREFDVRFVKMGPHRVEVTLPNDAILQDNARNLAIDVPDAHPVLVIQGDPTGEDSLYLRDALAPTEGLTGFAPRIESPDFLRRHPLDSFQTVYLLNVPQLHPDAVRALEGYCANGGGVAWFVGPLVNSAFYNSRLYKPTLDIGPVKSGLEQEFDARDTSRDGQLSVAEFSSVATGNEAGRLEVAFRQLDADQSGTLNLREFLAPRGGLFPVQLGTIADLPDDPQPGAIDVRFGDHPLFQMYQDEENGLAELVKVTRYFGVQTGFEPDVATREIARLRNGAPLFYEHRFGSGHVMTCLTTAGSAWTNWPQNPSYVVLFLEMQRLIAPADGRISQRVVGDPIVAEIDPANYSAEIRILTPGGKPEVRTAVPAAAAQPATAIEQPRSPSAGAELASVTFVDRFTDTDTPGIYELVRKTLTGTEETTRFAYNVPDSESRTAIETTDRIQKALPPETGAVLHEYGALAWIEGEQSRNELHDYVLLGLLAILLVEQLLALRLSFHPRHAGLKK